MPIVKDMQGQILDDVYIIEAPLPPMIQGVSVGIVGMVGSFVQGLQNAIYTINSYQDVLRYLGPSTKDVGGPIAINNLLRQGCGGIKVVPILAAPKSGTNPSGSTQAYVTIKDTSGTPKELGKLYAAQIHPQTSVKSNLYGSGPNKWKMMISNAGTGQVNLEIDTGVGVKEVYTKLTASNWAKTVNSQSKIVKVTQPSTPSTLAPQPPKTSPIIKNFGFGSCGTVTASTYIGTTSADDSKSTGLKLLETIEKNLIFAAEQTSETINSALATHADNFNCIAVICTAANKTPDAVIEAKGEAYDGCDNVVYCDGWVVCYDDDLKDRRTCAPTSLVVGMASTMGPHRHWGNKNINGVLSFVAPRNRAELIDLQKEGILCLDDNIPRGGFGTRSGVAADCSDIYVRRMRYFLEASILKGMGWAVDELQSTDNNDKLRHDVTMAISNFLKGLAKPYDPVLKVIDDYQVVCNKSNNPDSEIAAGRLYVTVKVRLLAAAKQIVICADISQGTVIVTSSDPETDDTVGED